MYIGDDDCLMLGKLQSYLCWHPHVDADSDDDMCRAGRNPGRILPGILLTFAAQHAERPVSMIGEPVWPGRRPAEYPACAVHEALINAVFAGRDVAILCPYDAKNLPAGAVADAHRTHPVMINEFGDRQPSATYGDPVHTAASFNYPLSPPPKHADSVRYEHRFQLRQVRAFVAAHAGQAGLSAERIADLTIAVNELATNTLEHTDGPGRLSMWTQDGTLHCQVEDSGQLTDPLAGRVPPAPQALRGRGLVLVNELCDLVRIYTVPGKTTVRLYTYLGRSAR